jgi:hypothetical protein
MSNNLETHYENFLDPLDTPAKLQLAKDHGSAQQVLNTTNIIKASKLKF